MIDFGTRPRCENCEYGHCEYDSRRKPVQAYCSKLNLKIAKKDFETFNCMYFEKREVKK